VGTRQAEVFECRLTAVLLGDDVVKGGKVNSETSASTRQYSQRFFARFRTRRSSDSLMAQGSCPACFSTRVALAFKIESTLSA
jgi:hypothetical protein